MRISTLLLQLPGILGYNMFSSNAHDNEIIRRDVVIIGGGATGSYAAVALKDIGRSVVVVEKASQLGGHTNTYRDPNTGQNIDYGVLVLNNSTVASDFYKRLGVATKPFIPSPDLSVSTYIDFRNGQSFNRTKSDLSSWVQQLERFPYLQYTRELPVPVPEDLVLPFAAFAKKHDLEDEVYDIFARSNGAADILNQLTENVMNSLGLDVLRPTTSAFIPASNANQDLYDAAAKIIADENILFDSVVLSTIERDTDNGVRLRVKHGNTERTIVASQLLITIPTTHENMSPFDGDRRELEIYDHTTATALYVGLVDKTGLDAGTFYYNYAAHTPYHLPELPALAYLSPTGDSGVFIFVFYSAHPLPREIVINEVCKGIKVIGGDTPEVLAFADHSPNLPTSSAGSIREGFYTKLYGLQGYRNTWYTGTDFLVSSAQLWNFTRTLIPPIDAAIHRQPVNQT